MISVLDIVFFLFGTIVGSFLNVVIFRYNTGKGIGGRSECFSCVRTLAWYELIPVFSFLFQGGRCRRCLSSISTQYPLVELASGLLFALLAHQSADPYAVAFSWLVFSILLVIAVYDYRHFIIPDGLVYAFIFLGAVSFVARAAFLPDLASALGLALFFVLLWAVSGGRWMGFGDAKLVLGMGLFLPFPRNVNAVIFGFWFGAAIGVLMLLVQAVRRISRKNKKGTHETGVGTVIPFAPFLVLGTLVSYLYYVPLW
ncbi:MAG: prepilin peptidase [Patescibacteria group bacterium]